MTTDRTTGLLHIRPVIQADLDGNPENSPAHFQNATLRPLLKLQNDLLLSMYRHYLQKTKGSFFQLSPPKQLEFIANSIRSDLRLRNMLVGTIVGHFTLEEWEVFAGQEQELTRRIADLLVERLCEQVGELVG